MIAFNEYPLRILDPEDKPLLEESVKAANAGALRSAYIMTWLCCAESIKRRFRIAAPRDGAANRIVGDCAQKESEEKSIDKFLIEKAREYGFVTDADYLRLKHIYEKRCIFGHPYETDPLESEVADAMNIATTCLLSKPVRMRHGYLDSQATQIVENKAFIDDYQPTVHHYAQEIIARSAPELLGWWIEKVWTRAQSGFFDPATPWLQSRIAWLSDEVLKAMDEDSIRNTFERSLTKNPLISSICLARTSAFGYLSPLVKDQVVSHLLESGSHAPSYVAPLFEQKRLGSLTKRQITRLDAFLAHSNLAVLSQAEVRLKDYFPRVISDLKSYNWNTQNPVAELLQNLPDDQIEELLDDEKEQLGRNILQAAEAAKKCASFIYNAAAGRKRLPTMVVFGMVAELFTNEQGKIRAKTENLNNVIMLLGRLGESDQDKIVESVATSIDSGIPKSLETSLFCGVSQPLEESFRDSQVFQQNQLRLLNAVRDAETRIIDEVRRQQGIIGSV